MFLLIAVTAVLIVAISLIATSRSRQDRPAVPGGTRRDHFGDALVLNGNSR